MALIVQKFGGTSVADIARIKNVARKVKLEKDKGNQVVVVVSAMAGVTNQLVSYTQEVSTITNSLNHDMVWSAGEQVTCGLLALALSEIGVPAQAMAGWQVPIQTTDHHGDAHIRFVDPDNLLQLMDQKITPVVAGFQGVNDNHSVTTLGRGGSDTTAVAIAASLKADRCDIYTDVDGIYTADPRIVTKAKKLNTISYEEILALSEEGAKVLHHKCVLIGQKEKVPLRVLSTFIHEDSGTDITLNAPNNHCVSGLAHTLNDVYISIFSKNRMHVDDYKEVLYRLEVRHFGFIKQEQMDNEYKISFVVPHSKEQKARLMLSALQSDLGFDRIVLDQEVARISVIGLELNDDTENIIYKLCEEKKINLKFFSTSPLKITFVIDQEYLELMLRALHHAFHLDKEEHL